MFMIRLLAGNVLGIILAAVILLIKKLFSGKISPRCHYFIWFPFLFFLGSLCLPGSFFRLFEWIAPAGSLTFSTSPEQALSPAAAGRSGDWMQDFSQSVSRMDLTFFLPLITGIWIAGMAVILFFFIQGGKKMRELKKHRIPPDRQTADLFQHCRLICGGKRLENVSIFESRQIQTPMALGIFRPMVLIPPHMPERFSKKEMGCILLHELVHIRHRDLYLNYVLSFFQIICWFNPMIFLAFRRLRLDREIYCDQTVIEKCGDSESLDYGYTLLHFASSIQISPSRTIGYLNGSKKQLKERLRYIASASPVTKKMKRTGIRLLCTAAALTLLQIPLLSVFASGSSQYQPEAALTIRDYDLSSFFNEGEGCFVLYRPGQDDYLIYNEKLSRTRVSPDSTYKIYAALHALEKHVITPDSQIRKWDGRLWEFSSWNQDQNLQSAMKNSVNWYFQDMDKEMGTENIRSFLTRIEYGNCLITGNPEDFWLESSLRISPLEQVMLLYRFYENTWGFDEKNVDAVRQALYLEKNNLGTLYGKTGSGKVNGKEIQGWFVGWLQTDTKPVFFAAYIRDRDHISGNDAAAATKNILEKLYS
ncbi:MAG: BlaR1 family beta-lactam sensor/signal transducer [Ruminococcus sp.]|jgi:bla regulator protein BlaR1